MLPWRNSWFQIAFFAWIVSGALLIVDYAPKIRVSSVWMQAFERTPRQPSEAPPKPSPPSEQQSPAKEPAPAQRATSPTSEKPVPPIENPSATKRPTPVQPAPSPPPAGPTTKAPNASGSNDGSAEFAQGKAAYDRKDYAKAMQWYQKSAAQGDADAENTIGLLYASGFGVPKDYAKAMRWFQKGAAQGRASDEYSIGLLYETGSGVPKDDAEAMRWFQKAAAQGHGLAKQEIAKLQADQKGPPEARPAPGPSSETPATKTSNAPGRNDGSAEYAQGTAADARKDYAQSMQWYQKAAAKGNADAEFRIGTLYAFGRGVPEDDAEGLRWYKKAAAQGNVIAASNIGYFYEHGFGGVPKDDAEALRWYQKAAAQGDDGAKAAVARMQAGGPPQ